MTAKIVKSAIIWIIVGAISVINYLAMLPMAIFFPFDKKRRIAHAQCAWWGNTILDLNPWIKINVSGLENIDKHKTYIIIANHQSLLDIFAIYRIRRQFKWVSKKNLFMVPFTGWSMSMAKYIKLSRGKIGSIKKVYRDTAYWLRNGISVVFFPEGTRSENDNLIDFKNGAFKLAIKEKVPIIPIYIEGTKEVLPKGNWIFETRAKCSLKVLPAIGTSHLQPKDYGNLRDAVRVKLKEQYYP